MSRRILCQSCGYNWQPHPQDVKEGWQHRAVHLSINRPSDHSVTVITGMTTDELIEFATKGAPRGRGQVTPLPSIFCDTCGNEIPDGSVALAVSMWREHWMIPWEENYGTVLPEDAVKLLNHLTK